MIATAATCDDIAYVVLRLREHSRREVFLQRAEIYTARDLYREMCAGTPMLQFALRPAEGDPPAAIFSVYRVSPVYVHFRLISTDAWPKVAGFVPRWMRRVVEPQVRAAGVHLAELTILADPPPNLRWFGLMGARPNGGPVPRGRNREPYLTLVCMDPPAAIDARPAGLSSVPVATPQGNADHVL